MNMFEQKKWINLNLQSRIARFQIIENEIAMMQGRQPRKVVADVEDASYKGYYTQNDPGRLHLNKEFVLSNEIGKQYEMLATVIHEGRHAYQFDCVQNKITNNENENTIQVWRENMAPGIYMDGKIDYLDYRFQPIEDDANNYAHEMLRQFEPIFSEDQAYRIYMTQMNRNEDMEKNMAYCIYGTNYEEIIKNKMHSEYQQKYGENNYRNSDYYEVLADKKEAFDINFIRDYDFLSNYRYIEKERKKVLGGVHTENIVHSLDNEIRTINEKYDALYRTGEQENYMDNELDRYSEIFSVLENDYGMDIHFLQNEYSQYKERQNIIGSDLLSGGIIDKYSSETDHYFDSDFKEKDDEEKDLKNLEDINSIYQGYSKEDINVQDYSNHNKEVPQKYVNSDNNIVRVGKDSLSSGINDKYSSETDHHFDSDFKEKDNEEIDLKNLEDSNSIYRGYNKGDTNVQDSSSYNKEMSLKYDYDKEELMNDYTQADDDKRMSKENEQVLGY